MKRFVVFLAAALPLGLGACSDPEVVTQASIAGPEGQRVNLAELPVQLLPYDRDAIFDSLTAAADEPEPVIPPELLQQQAQVQEAQAAWRTAEERWGEARDSLKQISTALTEMQQKGLRTTPQYKQLFDRFGALEAEERRQEQLKTEAFNRFTALQQATLARADSVRILREQWAERAYADFDKVVEAKLARAGLEPVADTTDAGGVARVKVPAGQWWVYSRYTLPYNELYWNEPIRVESDSVVVQLTEENAEERPVL